VKILIECTDSWHAISAKYVLNIFLFLTVKKLKHKKVFKKFLFIRELAPLAKDFIWRQ
jgi:hypothetical protein